MGNPVVSKIFRVVYGQGVLSDLSFRLPEQMLTHQLFSNVNSKYANQFNIGIFEEPGDEFGISALTSHSSNSVVRFLSDQIQINEDESATFNVEASDVLMFPKHIPFEVLDGEVTIKTFKTGNFPVLGDGDTKFKVEVTFADNYSIDVYANSEQEAIDFAYDTPMSYWVHHWEEDQELERFTTTRRTRWGKKMLKIGKTDV